VLGLAINYVGSRIAGRSTSIPGRASSGGRRFSTCCSSRASRCSRAGASSRSAACARSAAACACRLLDKSALAPFVRAGLRGSIVWLVGSSLATSLMFDVNAPWLVGVVIAGTMALGIAALLLPSAGLNERLLAEKRRELAWVRGEIARAREALGRSDRGVARRSGAAARAARVGDAHRRRQHLALRRADAAALLAAAARPARLVDRRRPGRARRVRPAIGE